MAPSAPGRHQPPCGRCSPTTCCARPGLLGVPRPAPPGGCSPSRGRETSPTRFLSARNIRSLDESWCAHCPGVLETDAHIFSRCHRARGVWARLGISVPDAIVRRPWDIGVNVPLPDAVRLDIVLLILWHLWKCRNAVVFDQNDSGPLDVLTRVDRDMDAWMSRYRKVSPSVQQWKAWLNHCASASPM
ncbi:hypothetical protein PVAP13_9KG600601 [Panicum virgatum]|uniref:Reverse transcriptase zinc-binding domain-containing protein n=1 Tax=Panicum virgatum TaxID=38727 RepID=A0A8T0NYS4_PANVG|nr:hypothetical protein PVAP13_9KG600601 [Panicum virgatum]